MNRITFWLLYFLLVPAGLRAQIPWGRYSQSFPEGALDKPETVALILAIPKENNSFWKTHGTSARFAEFAGDSAMIRLRKPQTIVARTTFDTARAQFFLHGVNVRNAGLYQFRVQEYPSKRLLVPWQAITRFTDDALSRESGLPQMAYLGGYKTSLGNMLVVDVRRRSTGAIVATNLVAWEPIRPAVTGIYASADLDIFLQKLQYPWAKTRTSQLTYSLDQLRLPATNDNLVYVLNADIYTKTQVQYQLLRNGQVVRPWGANDYDNSFVWLRGFLPGSYQLQIRYAAQPQHITECRFEVEPAWYQTIWFRLALAGAGLVVLALIAFAVLLIRQRGKTRLETVRKQKAKLEMQALYAQLNPHFVFNALSSIQGLVNQHDLQGANEYLSDFARLMRESLTNGSRDSVPLGKELQMMETYLKLEQLRFGFQYDMEVDAGLDVFSNSLPPMLWQPLLENAVKHGVAPLQQAGRIRLRISSSADNLLISVTDNGRGIPELTAGDGFGLRLTRDRIRLLNEMNPAQPILLQLTTNRPAGTEATLNFIHWLI